jgi:ABC-2 type transport system permease protein
MNNLKLAKNYFIIGFKGVIEYKYLLLTQTLSYIVGLIIAYGLWAYIFSLGYTQIQGFTLNDFILYYAVNLLISSMIFNVEEMFSDNVNNGGLLQYIIRNINPLFKHYFEMVGQNIFTIIILFILVMILVIIYSKFIILNFILFLVFVIIAIVIQMLILSLIALIAFKTERIGGIKSIIFMIISFLSGGWVPLTFFPEIIQQISLFLPFQYIKYFASMIILDKFDIKTTILGLIISIIWIIILYYLVKIGYKKGLKSFQAQGG